MVQRKFRDKQIPDDPVQQKCCLPRFKNHRLPDTMELLFYWERDKNTAGRQHPIALREIAVRLLILKAVVEGQFQRLLFRLKPHLRARKQIRAGYRAGKQG